MKKLLLFLIVLVGITGFVWSNGQNEGASGKTVIGVLTYDTTGARGEALNNWIDYLEANFDVEFILQAGGDDEAANIGDVENMITQGCDAIINYFNSPIDVFVEICEENDVYLVSFGSSVVQGLDAVSENPYYLGGVTQFPSDPAASGKAAAEVALNMGLKSFGATCFPPEIFPQPAASAFAFLATAADSGAKTAEPLIHMFDNVSGEVANYINESNDMDCIFGAAAPMDFIYPVLVSNDWLGKIKFVSAEIGQGTREGLESGAIIFASQDADVYFPLAFARVYDRLLGNSFPDEPSRVEMINTSLCFVSNTADYDNFIKYTRDFSNPCINADELRNLMVAYNPDATYADFIGFASRQSLTDIMNRR